MPILQRFGPTHWYLHSTQNSVIQAGRQLLDKVLQTCVVNRTDDKRSKPLSTPSKGSADNDLAASSSTRSTSTGRNARAASSSATEVSDNSSLSDRSASETNGNIVSDYRTAYSSRNEYSRRTTRSLHRTLAENEVNQDLSTGFTSTSEIVSQPQDNDPTSLPTKDSIDTSPIATAIGGNGHYHIGVWYGQGATYLTPSPDLKQEGRPREAVTNLLHLMTWIHDYVAEFVQPLVSITVEHDDVIGRTSTTHPLHARFRQVIDERSIDFDWLCKKVPFARDLLHPLYNVCVPFVGFTSNAHIDRSDAAPTLLLNFGYCRLHLPEYGTDVDLHPGDTIFLDTSVYHFTKPHPGYTGQDNDRWAISCYSQTLPRRQVCSRRYTEDKPILARTLLEQDETFRGRKKVKRPKRVRLIRKESTERAREEARNRYLVSEAAMFGFSW